MLFYRIPTVVLTLSLGHLCFDFSLPTISISSLYGGGIDNKQDVMKIQYYLAVLALRFFVCLAIKLIEIILSVNRNGSEKIHSDEIDIQNYFLSFSRLYLFVYIHTCTRYLC